MTIKQIVLVFLMAAMVCSSVFYCWYRCAQQDHLLLQFDGGFLKVPNEFYVVTNLPQLGVSKLRSLGADGGVIGGMTVGLGLENASEYMKYYIEREKFVLKKTYWFNTFEVSEFAGGESKKVPPGYIDKEEAVLIRRGEHFLIISGYRRFGYVKSLLSTYVTMEEYMGD